MKKIDFQTILVCGPTAVGKTAAAIELAQKIGAEIINADSGQVYRGMDIGTAKPTPEERKKASFHLIDILDPADHFSAADFRKRALEATSEIEARGKRVLIVGGTGLYLRALEQGLFEGPSRDPEVRRILEDEIEEKGVESLHAELQRVDPIAAASIPPRNRQRLIRALEVFRLTGRPISEFWREHRTSRGEGVRSFVKIGFTLPKDELHRRIEERIDRMIRDGFVEEVNGLLEKWGPNAPGFRLIGYKEIVSLLQGKISRDEVVSLIKKNTRQYAKRQLTWFKKDKEIQWVTQIQELEEDLTK